MFIHWKHAIKQPHSSHSSLFFSEYHLVLITLRFHSNVNTFFFLCYRGSSVADMPWHRITQLRQHSIPLNASVLIIKSLLLYKKSSSARDLKRYNPPFLNPQCNPPGGCFPANDPWENLNPAAYTCGVFKMCLLFILSTKLRVTIPASNSTQKNSNLRQYNNTASLWNSGGEEVLA